MQCPNNYKVSMFPGEKCPSCEYYKEDDFGTTLCTVGTVEEEQEETKKGGTNT